MLLHYDVENFHLCVYVSIVLLFDIRKDEVYTVIIMCFLFNYPYAGLFDLVMYALHSMNFVHVLVLTRRYPEMEASGIVNGHLAFCFSLSVTCWL